ncbi:AAA family ATPase [Bacillus rubiinfantis]|uniref:AAA family ATPase n=1 Tax=Bacillus rubiinfantis TaxID=1499680 RepID=UPI0005A7717C|nr:MoxR family ATPase [Bacillus rubiinfantis]
MSQLKEKEQQFLTAAEQLKQIKQELANFIVGQEEVIDQVLWSIFSGGHVLLEGLPGLGKTMLVRSISECLNLSFKRIQFTPDLMPADITGTMILQQNETGRQEFIFHQGPLFANIILADEINRATPKTQSALLEAMAEHTVTIMSGTKQLPQPFFVLATQNPIDMEGTYPLPEAQMDRFMCKILVGYPSKQELKEIALRTTGLASPMLQKIAGEGDVLGLQQLAKEIIVADELLDIAVSIIAATHPASADAPEKVKQFVQFGSGPRGLQSLLQMAKARALFAGRFHLSLGDLKQTAVPVLRHRLLLNFEGEAGGITTDELILEIIEDLGKDGRRK